MLASDVFKAFARQYKYSREKSLEYWKTGGHLHLIWELAYRDIKKTVYRQRQVE